MRWTDNRALVAAVQRELGRLETGRIDPGLARDLARLLGAGWQDVADPVGAVRRAMARPPWWAWAGVIGILGLFVAGGLAMAQLKPAPRRVLAGARGRKRARRSAFG